VFLGGKPGRDLTKDAALIKKYADQIEKIFPGAKEAKNNKNGVINWSKHPFALGSYAAYKTGQWSLLDTEEMMKPAGRLYFAGEHCSERFQGFMNGAAETGRKAAEGIITAVQKMQHASMITTSMNS
jgi:monoamine oxidase